jgi:hypothetical protein
MYSEEVSRSHGSCRVSPNSLDGLGLSGLLIEGGGDLLVATAGHFAANVAEAASEANFGVDLLHALLVGGGDTAGSEDDVHLFESELFGLRNCGIVSILGSGTDN